MYLPTTNSSRGVSRQLDWPQLLPDITRRDRRVQCAAPPVKISAYTNTQMCHTKFLQIFQIEHLQGKQSLHDATVVCNVQPLSSSVWIHKYTNVTHKVFPNICKYFTSSICKEVKCRCKVQYPVPPSRMHAQKYKLVTWNICQDKNVCKALSSPPKAFITPCKFARITVCAIQISMCYQVLCSKYVLALLSSLLIAFYDDIRNTLNNI